MENLVTIEKLKEQIWEIEGVKVNVHTKEGDKRLVRPYNFERLSDDATVEELKERIKKCTEPFIYFVS